MSASDQLPAGMKYGLEERCIEDNWKLAGKTDSLVCASKEIYVESLTARETALCLPSQPITLTVDASIIFTGARSDIGWYIASDRSDALVGTCVTNGLKNSGAGYNVVDIATGASTVGAVKWTTSAGNDECGDVVLREGNTAARMTIPVLVNSTIMCSDENEDRILDVAICLTWKAASDVSCSLSSIIPDNIKGCFCTRVNIRNVDYMPDVDDVLYAPCSNLN